MEWISVKDKLPEHNTPVIILVQMLGVITCRLAHRPSNAGDASVWRTEIGMFLDEATHWIPMPQPPK